MHNTDEPNQFDQIVEFGTGQTDRCIHGRAECLACRLAAAQTLAIRRLIREVLR